jgi:hypothetical protein
VLEEPVTKPPDKAAFELGHEFHNRADGVVFPIRDSKHVLNKS